MRAILDVILLALDLYTWIIIASAVLSWLIAFNVINTYNETVRAIWVALKRITDPIYNPIRRILPDVGALDLSPLVVLIILFILSDIVIPRLELWWIGMVPL